MVQIHPVLYGGKMKSLDYIGDTVKQLRSEYDIPFTQVSVIQNLWLIEKIYKKIEDTITPNDTVFEWRYNRREQLEKHTEPSYMDMYKGDEFYVAIRTVVDDMGELRKVAFVFANDIDEAIKSFDKIIPSSPYEPGVYTLQTSSQGFKLSPVNIKNVEKPILNDNIDKYLFDDLKYFFNNKKFYEDNELAYKRGILMYGPPGTGKTQTIRHFLSQHSDKYCIIVDATKDYYDGLADFMKIILKDHDCIIVFEDIDGMSDYNRSSVLNFLDGVDNINAFFIATSNDLSKIDRALVDRPSRFDRFYEIGLPNKDTRRKLLLRWFPELEKDETLLEKLIKMTDKYTGAYFKELFIFSNIQGVGIEEAVEHLNKQIIMLKEYGKTSDMFG